MDMIDESNVAVKFFIRASEYHPKSAHYPGKPGGASQMSSRMDTTRNHGVLIRSSYPFCLTWRGMSAAFYLFLFKVRVLTTLSFLLQN